MGERRCCCPILLNMIDQLEAGVSDRQQQSSVTWQTIDGGRSQRLLRGAHGSPFILVVRDRQARSIRLAPSMSRVAAANAAR